MLLDRRPAGRRFSFCGHARLGIDFQTTPILPRHGGQNAVTLNPSLATPASPMPGDPGWTAAAAQARTALSEIGLDHPIPGKLTCVNVPIPLSR